ncbi:extracellular solute-binding protein [Paenibacillus contaminans]|uniref:extracellular solute-binding protein n=1 Tax=Paenibacillus contaminans TaxID=450362 RepID=UPI0013149ECA|nr:extracellular solute-binding protein [Paenibacillus contaminans]
MLKKRTEFDDRYQRFRREIRNQIISSTLKPGDFLLSEVNLSKLYNLSRDSVRKVLAELEQSGLIEKIPGKGNIVRESEQWKEETVLRLVCFDDSYEIPTLLQLISEFEQENPRVRIEFSTVSENGYGEYLSDKLRDNEAHDMMVISDLHFRKFADEGLLDKLHASHPYEWAREEDVYGEAVRLFQDGNQLKAVPFVFSPVVYVVNKNLVPEADRLTIDDWSDLTDFAVAHTVKDEQGTVQHYGFGFTITNNRWPQFLLQNGGGIFDAEHRSIFGSGETVEAFRYCLDLMFNREVSPASIYGGTRIVEDLFMKQKVAMIIGTYHYMNEFGNHFMEWDVVPVVPRNSKKATLLLGGALAINASSPHVTAAKRFAQFLVRYDSQKQFKMNGCTIPVLRKVAEDQTLFNPAIHPRNYHCFVDMLPYAHSIQSLGIGQRDLDQIQKELVLMWMKMEDPEDSVKRIEEQMFHHEGNGTDNNRGYLKV